MYMIRANHLTVLDPTQKMEHIWKYWGAQLLNDALGHAEEMVFVYYLTCTIYVN